MAISLLGLIVIVLLGGAILVFLARSWSMPRWGHATLTCPHCANETKLTDGKCEHCQRDL